MAYYQATISHGTTGVKTRTPGFQPLAAKITVVPFSAATELQKSVGTTNGTIQITDTDYVDPNRSKQERFSDRMAHIYKWNSGSSSYDTKFRADFDSFTATEFKYNVVTADSNYQLLVEVWG